VLQAATQQWHRRNHSLQVQLLLQPSICCAQQPNCTGVARPYCWKLLPLNCRTQPQGLLHGQHSGIQVSTSELYSVRPVCSMFCLFKCCLAAFILNIQKLYTAPQVLCTHQTPAAAPTNAAAPLEAHPNLHSTLRNTSAVTCKLSLSESSRGKQSANAVPHAMLTSTAIKCEATRGLLSSSSRSGQRHHGYAQSQMRSACAARPHLTYQSTDDVAAA
jgi:hypothetical protein